MFFILELYCFPGVMHRFSCGACAVSLRCMRMRMIGTLGQLTLRHVLFCDTVTVWTAVCARRSSFVWSRARCHIGVCTLPTGKIAL